MLQVFIFVCVFDECIVIICGWVLDHMLDAFLGCMVLPLECGLRHFLLKYNVGYVKHFISDVTKLSL